MGQFKKGQSGNPSGRPAGISQQKKFRDMIESEIPSLVETVVKQAMDGDSTAMRICMDRIFPQTKARDELIKVEGIKAAHGLVHQANAVLNELAESKITPSEAVSIMNTITAKSKLVETEELLERIQKVEEQLNNRRN